jgi:hypothetical protein
MTEGIIHQVGLDLLLLPLSPSCSMAGERNQQSYQHTANHQLENDAARQLPSKPWDKADGDF